MIIPMGFFVKILSRIRTDMMSRSVLFLTVTLIVFSTLIISMDSAFALEPKKILSIEAYDMLNTVPDTYLIDVRTRAEYQFVGHPVGAHLFPYMFMTHVLKNKDGDCEYQFNLKNKDFINEMSNAFQKTNNLLIISRDGTRSEMAAKALVNVGFKNVFNVSDGFEGAEFPHYEDNNKQKYYRQLARRNTVYGFNLRRHYGWQWWGLPWTYKIDPKCIYPPDMSPPDKK